MSGVELSAVKSCQSNLEVYNSHDPEDFSQALQEFSQYCERQLPHKYLLAFIPTCFTLTNDEQSLVIGGSIGNIANFSIEKGQILRDEEISHSNAIISVEVVLNDSQVVALTANFELFFLEFPSFEVLYRTSLKAFPVVMKQNPKMNVLYLTNGGEELSCITLSNEDDFYTKKYRKRQIPMNDLPCSLQVSTDGSLLAVGFEKGMITIFHANNEKPLKSIEECEGKPLLIAFSKHNSYMAASFEDYSIKVWAMGNNLNLLHVLSRHSDTVSGLAFVRDNKYLVSSSFDTFINVWDMKVECLPYAMSMNELRVTGISLFSDHKTVAYTQESDSIFIWCVPQLPRNARYRGQSQKLSKLLFVPDSYDLITLSEDGQVNFWDYRQDKHIETVQLEGSLSNGIIIGSFVYIQSTKPCIYRLSTSSLKYDIIELPSSIINFDITSDESMIATSYSQNSVKVHELKLPNTDPGREPKKSQLTEMVLISVIKGHTSPVALCRFIKNNNFLITGSIDSTLAKWETMSGKRIGTFTGHYAAITTFIVSQDDFLISASEDGFVNVWSFDCILLYTLKPLEEGPTVDLYLSLDHSYLITLQSQRVTYWQLLNLTILFQTDTTYPSSCIAMSYDEKSVAISEGGTVFIEDNAMACNSLRIVGRNLGSPHRFMKFVMDSQKDQSKVEYDMSHNHWLIAPYMIGPAHILAYTNRFAELSRGLFLAETKCGFFSTIKNENPLSICIDKEYKNCIDICLKYMKLQMQGSETSPSNSRAYYPLENCLTQLNLIDYPYIVKLYDSLFVESSANYLPRFCLHETELPTLYFSDHLTLIPEELVPKENFSNTGRPIVFSYSTFPLDLDIGTDGSIEFMKSLLECSHQEIYRSALVKEYLQYKWGRVKNVIYVQGALYVLYLILLGFHIVLYLEDRNFLAVLFTVHATLWLFEVWQISTDFSEYWNSVWNVLDQLRGLSFNYYALIALKGTYNYEILLAVLIFSWARGIACFRMFESSRSMVRLIIQVIIDIRIFFLILFYSTCAFAFIFYMRDPYGQPFLMNLTRAYRLNLGDFETDLHEYFDWGIFFVSTLINPLMMLNLLIAIMSDTAAAGAEVDDICSLRELTEMILDVEKIMFWRKGISHKHYLQKCDFVVVEGEDTDKVMAKIRFIKKQVISIKGVAKNIQRNTERICSIDVKSHVEELISAQEKLKVNMKENFEHGKNVIQAISKKLDILE